MTRNRTRKLFYAAFSALVLMAMAARYESVRRRTARRTVSLTVEQALAHSERLCRRLNPNAGALLLSSEWIDMGRRRYWEVNCTDARGNQLAHMVWNADTGALWAVADAVTVAPPDRRFDRPLSSREAVRAAGAWLHRLEPPRPSSRWRLLGSPVYEGGNWNLWCGNQSRKIFLVVNSYTGNLIMARL